METQGTRKLHPLLATAAVAVIVLAVVGIGAFTGLLPGSVGSPKADDLSASPEPSPAAEPVAKAAPKQAPIPEPKPMAEHRPASKPVQVAAAKPQCLDCGMVEAVREVDVKGQGTGLGAVAGGVLGGVIGHQMGSGRGNTAMTVLGAAGGALAGNEVEKRTRASKHWDVTVRLDHGGTRTISTPTQPMWRAGDRVRIVNDAVQPANG
ncbi:MAG: glycine zipper 2TM domain-containing protein [Burkholderiales bacterium]